MCYVVLITIFCIIKEVISEFLTKQKYSQAKILPQVTFEEF